jgi:uncharacterized protein (TIGR02594 family)
MPVDAARTAAVRAQRAQARQNQKDLKALRGKEATYTRSVSAPVTKVVDGRNVQMGTKTTITPTAVNGRRISPSGASPVSKVVTRNLSREQQSLADALKSPSVGGANVGIRPGTDISSLNPASRASLQESINQRTYGTARPVFRIPETTQIRDTGIDQTEQPITRGTTQPISRPIVNVGEAVQENIPGYYNTQPEAPQSLQDIRQDTLSRYQQMVSATQDYYTNQIQNIQEQGRQLAARVGSMDVGAGLAGSPFAQGNQNQVQEATNRAIQQVAAQRSAEVAGYLNDAYNKADQLYQQRIENYQQQQGVYISERDKLLSRQDKMIADQEAKKEALKKSAVESIGNIATGGYSIDELPEAQYQKLLQDSGMSDFEARAIWVAKTPEANASYSVSGDYLVQQYFDPRTGKAVVKATPLPDELKGSTNPSIKTITTGDGQVYWYDENNPVNPDGSLNAVPIGGKKSSSSEGAPTIKTFAGQDYQWNESTGSWDVVSLPDELSSQQSEKAKEIKDVALDLLSDESLGAAVGPISSRLPTLFGGTSDFEEKYNHLKSLLTLDNIGLLKGTLSDRDMQILESAGTALSLRMSEEGFKEELQKIIGISSSQVGDVLSDYEPDQSYVNALRNSVKVDAQGNPLSEDEIDALARYATMLTSQGKTQQEIIDSINAALRGEKQSFNQDLSMSQNGSPLEIAKSYIGLNASNPKQAKTLSAFFKKAGGLDVDPATTAWCAAFANSVLGASGIKGTGSLMAQSFLKFGTPVEKPAKGDIVVFERGKRGSGLGHVGFVVGVNENGTLKVLGGNQNNSTSIQTFKTDRVLGYRRINKKSVREYTG